MLRERIEFYQDEELIPDVVLIETIFTSDITPEDRVLVLNDNMQGLPKGNPALVALEYVLAFNKPGVCELTPAKADSSRPDAYRIRCYRDELRCEKFRQGRKVA